MDRLRGLLVWLRTLARKGAVERELDAEMEFHVEMQERENLRAGMDPAAARRAALVAFGGVERYKERRREASRARLIEDVMADVRYAGRMIVRRPGFAAAVIVSLGLSIGGTTAIFSVVDRLFLRAPAGIKDPEQVRKLFVRRDAGGIRTPEGGPGSYIDFESMRDHATAFSTVAAYEFPTLLDLGRGEDAEQIRGMYATWQFLPLLGVRPALGRLILPEEDSEPGVHQVAVISHSMWQRRYGGAADVLGQKLLLNGREVRIVGVAEEGFSGVTGDPTDVFLPMAAAHSPGSDFRTIAGMAGYHYVGRMAPGATEARAVQQASLAMAHAAEARKAQDLDPTPELLMTRMTYAADPVRSKTVDLSLWLTLVAAFVVVIACANVANLLLARCVAARRELTVRLALGASRGRLIRQHLTESGVLALLGGVAGLMVTRAAIGLIRQFPLPPDTGTIDLRVLAFTLALSMTSGLLFGILPALRSGSQPMSSIRETRSTLTVTGVRARRVLVAVQMTLCVVLVIGAGLFVRSLRAAYAIDPGVDVDRVTAVRVNLVRSGIAREEREDFYEQVRTRLASLPGVERSALVHFHPFSGSAMGADWKAPKSTAVKFEEGPYLNLAGPGYFEAAGTRILRGRGFRGDDGPGAEPVAVVNESMARGIAPDGQVVGQCVPIETQVTEGGCTRIIGVVENQRHRYLEDKRVPMIFLSRMQNPALIGWGGPALVVRTHGPAAEFTGDIRAAIQSLRPNLPFVTIRPLTEIVRRDVLPYRLGATLFSLFGLLALVLSTVGLAGVLSYFVAERTSEIGIRRSLGAPIRKVVSLVVRQALAPVAFGIAIGVVTALVTFRFIGSLLFGVSGSDPVTFGGAVAFLMVMATLASLVPAVRAARIDPTRALKLE